MLKLYRYSERLDVTVPWELSSVLILLTCLQFRDIMKATNIQILFQLYKSWNEWKMAALTLDLILKARLLLWCSCSPVFDASLNELAVTT